MHSLEVASTGTGVIRWLIVLKRASRHFTPGLSGDAEAIASLLPATAHVVYAANRISSNLRGSTKQFGWLQAPATISKACLRIGLRNK